MFVYLESKKESFLHNNVGSKWLADYQDRAVNYCTADNKEHWDIKYYKRGAQGNLQGWQNKIG